MKCMYCDKKVHALNMCSSHYGMQRRYGNPNSCYIREKWDLDEYKKRIFHNAKRRAKLNGLDFTIRANDIVIPEICPVLGIKIEHGTGKFCDNSPSLDRVRPELGYVPGNVVVISWRANRIKNDSTKEELEKILNYVKENSK